MDTNLEKVCQKSTKYEPVHCKILILETFCRLFKKCILWKDERKAWNIHEKSSIQSRIYLSFRRMESCRIWEKSTKHLNIFTHIDFINVRKGFGIYFTQSSSNKVEKVLEQICWIKICRKKKHSFKKNPKFVYQHMDYKGKKSYSNTIEP